MNTHRDDSNDDDEDHDDEDDVSHQENDDHDDDDDGMGDVADDDYDIVLDEDGDDEIDDEDDGDEHEHEDDEDDADDDMIEDEDDDIEEEELDDGGDDEFGEQDDDNDNSQDFLDIQMPGRRLGTLERDDGEANDDNAIPSTSYELGDVENGEEIDNDEDGDQPEEDQDDEDVEDEFIEHADNGLDHPSWNDLVGELEAPAVTSSSIGQLIGNMEFDFLPGTGSGVGSAGGPPSLRLQLNFDPSNARGMDILSNPMNLVQSMLGSAQQILHMSRGGLGGFPDFGRSLSSGGPSGGSGSNSQRRTRRVSRSFNGGESSDSWRRFPSHIGDNEDGTVMRSDSAGSSTTVFIRRTNTEANQLDGATESFPFPPGVHIFDSNSSGSGIRMSASGGNISQSHDDWTNLHVARGPHAAGSNPNNRRRSELAEIFPIAYYLPQELATRPVVNPLVTVVDLWRSRDARRSQYISANQFRRPDSTLPWTANTNFLGAINTSGMLSFF